MLTQELGQPGSRELGRKRWTQRAWVAEHQSVSFGSVITEIRDKVYPIPFQASTLGNPSLGCCKIRLSYHPEGSFLQREGKKRGLVMAPRKESPSIKGEIRTRVDDLHALCLIFAFLLGDFDLDLANLNR